MPNIDWVQVHSLENNWSVLTSNECHSASYCLMEVANGTQNIQENSKLFEQRNSLQKSFAQ